MERNELEVPEEEMFNLDEYWTMFKSKGTKKHRNGLTLLRCLNESNSGCVKRVQTHEDRGKMKKQAEVRRTAKAIVGKTKWCNNLQYLSP